MIFFQKRSKIFAGVLSAIVQVANLFIGNIIVYESTEKVRFDWMMLLKSWLFWLVLICTVIYYAIAQAVKQESEKIDEAVEKAISDSSTEIIKIVTKNAQSGNFESCKEAIKLFDKMQKRRRM